VGGVMEGILSLAKDNLLEALDEWVERNKDVIGEKLANRLKKEAKRFSREYAEEEEFSKEAIVGGFSLWLFHVLHILGVKCSAIGGKIEEITILPETWEKGFDKQSTERLVRTIKHAFSISQNLWIIKQRGRKDDRSSTS